MGPFDWQSRQLVALKHWEIYFPKSLRKVEARYQTHEDFFKHKGISNRNCAPCPRESMQEVGPMQFHQWAHLMSLHTLYPHHLGFPPDPCACMYSMWANFHPNKTHHEQTATVLFQEYCTVYGAFVTYTNDSTRNYIEVSGVFLE